MITRRFFLQATGAAAAACATPSLAARPVASSDSTIRLSRASGTSREVPLFGVHVGRAANSQLRSVDRAALDRMARTINQRCQERKAYIPITDRNTPAPGTDEPRPRTLGYVMAVRVQYPYLMGLEFWPEAHCAELSHLPYRSPEVWTVLDWPALNTSEKDVGKQWIDPVAALGHPSLFWPGCTWVPDRPDGDCEVWFYPEGDAEARRGVEDWVAVRQQQTELEVASAAVAAGRFHGTSLPAAVELRLDTASQCLVAIV